MKRFFKTLSIETSALPVWHEPGAVPHLTSPHEKKYLSPRISVIMPLYNKAATVERALASICAQTYRNIEIIIVDDGSTDRGAQVAASFPDERIRIMRQSNAGPGAARNRGIEASNAELVTFLDADDEWLPTFLERSVERLDRVGSEVVAVVSGYFEGAQKQSTTDNWRKRKLREGVLALSAETPAEFVVTVLAYMNPWAMVVRRSTIVRYGGFYEAQCRYGEDNYLWLKVILNESIFVSLEPLVCWHSEASGLSRNLVGARPIEPFFTDPAGLFAACPDMMRSLLRDVLAVRAGKTAVMLSYWGHWREARRLMKAFCRLGDLRFFWVRIGYPASTPIGAAFAWLIRSRVGRRFSR